MHQYRFAALQPAADTQGEVHRKVVEQQARSRLEAHVVGQLEHPVGGEHRDLGHAAGEHRQPDNPVAGTHVRILGRRADHAGDLGSEHKRRLWPVLVEATGEQGVRKRCAGGVHVDHYTLAGGFVDL